MRITHVLNTLLFSLLLAHLIPSTFVYLATSSSICYTSTSTLYRAPSTVTAKHSVYVPAPTIATTKLNPLVTECVHISSDFPVSIDTKTVWGDCLTRTDLKSEKQPMWLNLTAWKPSTVSCESSIILYPSTIVEPSTTVEPSIILYPSTIVEPSTTVEPSTDSLQPDSETRYTSTVTFTVTSSGVDHEPSVYPSPPEEPQENSPNGFDGDLMIPISTDDVPSVFPRAQSPLDMASDIKANVLQTSKFYTNLYKGSRRGMIWPQPYGMSFLTTDFYGWAVQHTDPDRRVFGSQYTNNPQFSSYFFNPLHLREMVFSATAFDSSVLMELSDLHAMSIKVTLTTGVSESDFIEIPVVQGMGMVTSIYHGNLVPRLNSAVGFRQLVLETTSDQQTTKLKYRATLFDATEYLLYVIMPTPQNFYLSVTDSYTIVGSHSIEGLIIQLAVVNEASDIAVYDQTSGMFVTSAATWALSNYGELADYGFSYLTEGTSLSGEPLVFLHQHHEEALTLQTSSRRSSIRLSSTTKGMMTGYTTSTVHMYETLSYQTQFLPWVEKMGNPLPRYTTEQLRLIGTVVNQELNVDIMTLILSTNSNYFAGKALDRYAFVLLVTHDILQDAEVSRSLLVILKETIAVFTQNNQYWPLMYDTKFGGITSTAAQSGDVLADFGASYYNDHHFHYSYFIHAAAVIGRIDKAFGGTWAQDNHEWVEALIRDVANPSADDHRFPVFRHFDWFAGHSWASGLFEAGDGNNEESTSEDLHFAYAMKLWGKVIGDGAMENRGDLMISVLRRSLNKYFYYTRDNTVQPASFIGNKVSGILFENKIDYTTWFGNPLDNPEFVHGIHMLPITPASSLARGPVYVKEEWDDQISLFIDNVNSGWKGILKLNQALYDGTSSYDFFAANDFLPSFLDDGQSRAWSLVFSGAAMNG